MMTRTLFYTLGFALAAILTTGGAGAALAADITGSVDAPVPGRGMLNTNVNTVG